MTPDLNAAQAGDFSSVSYTLSDMAADTVGLMDALGFESVHLVGASKAICLSHIKRSLFGTTQETRSRLSTFAPLAPGFATRGRKLWTFLKADVAILDPRPPWALAWALEQR